MARHRQQQHEAHVGRDLGFHKPEEGGAGILTDSCASSHPVAQPTSRYQLTGGRRSGLLAMVSNRLPCSIFSMVFRRLGFCRG
mmetsp:Transcript_89327/g.248079  ORF Transcript_89327/g.248079 Transcript_89327/m.248079 type:complete len:83 (+) Transcript_89327:230-478(+)